MIPATLYMRPGCHLCEIAEADLAALQRRLPHTLELVDVSGSTELEARYGRRIPVLVINGQEYATPLLRAVIERALRDAHAGRAGGTAQ